jgi:hypothetical protein
LGLKKTKTPSSTKKLFTLTDVLEDNITVTLNTLATFMETKSIFWLVCGYKTRLMVNGNVPFISVGDQPSKVKAVEYSVSICSAIDSVWSQITKTNINRNRKILK